MENRAKGTSMMTRRIGQFVLILGTGALLAGCDAGSGAFGFLTANRESGAASAPAGTTLLVERDVEAPNVFSLTDMGLWDGRPSLGGVWVADADVKDPERVIIRNTANGKFVIGALFRRERDNPGPRVQVSSDAAAALGLLAGQPAELNIVALRREEIAPSLAQPAPVSAPPLGPIESKPLDQLTATAAAAITAAEAGSLAAAPAKAFVQIGIFSFENNAERAAMQLRTAGLTPTLKKETSQGKIFWRVLAGPAASLSEREALMARIKALGYTDAYAVSN
jgi:rare lipoprotein A